MDANPTPQPAPLDDDDFDPADRQMKILDRLFGGRDKPKRWTKWRRLRPTARHGHAKTALYRKAGGGTAWAAYRRRQQDHLDATRQVAAMDAAGMLPPMKRAQRDQFTQQHAANITAQRGAW